MSNTITSPFRSRRNSCELFQWSYNFNANAFKLHTSFMQTSYKHAAHGPDKCRPSIKRRVKNMPSSTSTCGEVRELKKISVASKHTYALSTTQCARRLWVIGTCVSTKLLHVRIDLMYHLVNLMHRYLCIYIYVYIHIRIYADQFIMYFQTVFICVCWFTMYVLIELLYFLFKVNTYLNERNILSTHAITLCFDVYIYIYISYCLIYMYIYIIQKNKQ